MKERFRDLALHGLLLVALCVSAANSQEFKSVRDGVEYAEITRTIDNQPVRMNLLRLDLKKVRLDVVHAMDAAIGTETVSSMGTRHHALAAINSGFFRLDESSFAGDPDGILQIDGKLLSESKSSRVALMIHNSVASCVKCKDPHPHTEVMMSHLETFGELWTEGRRMNIIGIDREIKDNDAVIYTPEFGTSTPKSNLPITEVVIQNKRIVSIADTSGGSSIPQGGYVLSTTGSKRSELTGVVRQGTEGLIILGSYIENPNTSPNGAKMAFTNVEDIVGGVPQLIKDGKIDIDWEQEKTTKSFVETRHPRTAVAKLKDGKFLMIAVDGRSESSGGISLYDLAAYLLELGATEAMNLDGGGSTTMFLDGKVVNHPSDKEGERKVSDAIIITLRKK